MSGEKASNTTTTLLHEITILERKLHGIITQRERLGVNSKEAEETELELKKSLVDKKQRLRAIMEAGEPPAKPPRQPALIKNGIALEMLAAIIEIEDKLCSVLPVIELKAVEAAISAALTGPLVVSNTTDDGAANYQLHPAPSSPHGGPGSGPSCKYAACSLSTYPRVPEGGTGRQGDPICDRFAVQIHKNAVVAALADGCNWGRLPFEAANKATTGFLQYVTDRITTITSLRGAGSLLLAALSAANKKIMEGLDHWECGTTTLIGGLLLPLLPSSHAPPIGALPRSSSWSSSNSLPNLLSASPTTGRTRAGSTSCTNNNKTSTKWVFACVSLGDCKAFHYSQRTQEFTDITEGNRQNLTDARDPGGRLGPYIEANPDLRNLHLYYHFADPGDIIMLVSDGVHDNLDPQQLGIKPPETVAKVDSWEEAEKIAPELVEAFKNNYRKRWLEDTFSKLQLEKESSGKKLDVKTIVDVLLQHCVNITKTSREFMEQNPKLKLPPDFATYPGKLDHATCVCLTVGAHDD